MTEIIMTLLLNGNENEQRHKFWRQIAPGISGEFDGNVWSQRIGFNHLLAIISTNRISSVLNNGHNGGSPKAIYPEIVHIPFMSPNNSEFDSTFVNTWCENDRCKGDCEKKNGHFHRKTFRLIHHSPPFAFPADSFSAIVKGVHFCNNKFEGKKLPSSDTVCVHVQLLLAWCGHSGYCDRITFNAYVP